MLNQTVLSGIKPSGIPTLGNYIGAVSQWVDLQNKYSQALFPIVDLHAITTPQDPKTLRENTYLMTALLLASGIDPKRCLIFVQSQVAAHAELGWIMTTQTNMGELSRMTQYKDKLHKLPDTSSVGAGLFAYPALMAADILLYGTNVVPVGEDQKQHVELTRDLAERFNKRHGKTFVVPKPLIRQSGARIMDLQDPAKKMSKSDESDKGYILITDSPEAIRKKIMSATTDSHTAIEFDPSRTGLYNLLTIYKILSGKTESQIEKHFTGKGYGAFKSELAELIIDTLSPIRQKIEKLLKDKPALDRILAQGAKRATALATPTLVKVKSKIGFVA